jgi:hypothetical protein
VIMLDLALRQKMFDDESSVACSVLLPLDSISHHVHAFPQHGVDHAGRKVYKPNESLYCVSRYFFQVILTTVKISV